MTTFALIHGAWGTGWHWASIPERLRAAGHDVVAPDLPCEDPGATFEDYAQVVVDALDGADDVVVAALSLGGLTAPLVPARTIVYVAAMLPVPGLTLLEQFERDHLLQPEYLAGIARDGRGGTRWADFDVYLRVAYEDGVPESVARERFDRLRTQSGNPYTRPCSLDALPDVPTRYVLCTGDRLINNAYWRDAVEVTDELDCGHSPMVTRPEELTALLLESA